MAYKVVSNNFKDLMKAMSNAIKADASKLMAVSGFVVDFGVPEKKAEGAKEGDIFISDYARDVHFGVMEKRIPARPFLSTVQTRYQNRIRADVKKALEENKEEMLGEEVDAELIAKKNMEKNVALKLIDYTRDNILNGAWQPNRPSTILLKGSSRPLIDDGQMKDSITSVVRKKK